MFVFHRSDVVTLFHEFGHGLQHMLTTETDVLVSGIAGIEQDAVEQPSQFLERWCAVMFHQAALPSGSVCTCLVCGGSTPLHIDHHRHSCL